MSKDTKDFKPEAADMAVLQDYQLAVNHMNAAMGRFLGHIGVAKHGLTEGEAYEFHPEWKNGVIKVTIAEKPVAAKKLET